MISSNRCKAHYQGDRCLKSRNHDSGLNLLVGNSSPSALYHESENWRWDSQGKFSERKFKKLVPMSKRLQLMMYHSDKIAKGLNREAKKEFVKTLDKLITLSKEKR